MLLEEGFPALVNFFVEVNHGVGCFRRLFGYSRASSMALTSNDQASRAALNQQLAIFNYLKPLLTNRRVAVMNPASADHVVAHLNDTVGVASADIIRSLSTVSYGQEGFDAVLVPDGARLVSGSDVALRELKRRLAPGGQLVTWVPNDEVFGRQGVDFYDFSDALEAVFPQVRLFGQAAFLAFGLAAFEAGGDDFQLDASMAEAAGEDPTHYLAVASAEASGASEGTLPYTLVQIPSKFGADVVRAVPEIFGPLDAPAVKQVQAPGARSGAANDSKGSPGAGGIGAEIEKALRAEIDHLKGALRKADATVVDLTRQASKEMSALAEKLTAGLRRPDPGTRESTSDRPVDAAADDAQKDLKTQEARVRELTEALASRDTALVERDERVAELEAENKICFGGPRRQNYS